jgi:hypothetical protein
VINIAEQVPNALGGAYPPTQVTPEKNAFEVENKRLTGEVTKLTETLQSITDENSQLKKKLTATEDFIKIRYAEQIADAKIGRKMLKKEDRAGEVEKLKAYSQDTLKVLSEELTKMQVELSRIPDEPAPLAPPAQPPVTESPEQKMGREENDMRQKLFGHTEPADVFYTKQMEAKLSRRMM